MSAWIVPESRFEVVRPAAARRAMYMARRIHADGLIVIDTEICSRSMPSKSMLDVGEGVDGDALAADLAFGERVVGVVAHQRRHVEVGRQSGLALGDQVLEALVRVLGGAEAGDLAHRPQPAPIHRRVRSARERVLAGQADVGERRIGRVERGVDALEWKTAQRSKLRAPLGLPRDERRDLVPLPGFDLVSEIRERWCRGRNGTATIRVIHASSLVPRDVRTVERRTHAIERRRALRAWASPAVLMRPPPRARCECARAAASPPCAGQGGAH